MFHDLIVLVTLLLFTFQVSGIFRLNTPSVLLGYDRAPDSMSRVQASSQPNSTYLSVFVTIEPPLTAPEALKEKVNQSTFKGSSMITWLQPCS